MFGFEGPNFGGADIFVDMNNLEAAKFCCFWYSESYLSKIIINVSKN